ncbi:extracellular solute-binding protein [Acetatifactor muris]|uniref:Lipoprotein LipO n=1 Tax=Acetatifactor muris TaxID=879566 RepID=A0A2K4ZJN3_9FIRM|nr:extracellular solute-binding protein [Acetatifactor muris]MCR2048961.1 extracellular solute-binding protein [Acetatifactor muris]SOY30670.1 Lipoprotein LipO precursor [Acetatifactor muris]
MRKKKLIALGLAVTMLAGCLTGCGNEDGNGSSDSSAAESSSSVDAAGDSSSPEQSDANNGSFTYAGEGPITDETGKSLTILAQTSNYTNVDIASAEIVKTVVAASGVDVEWQLVDYNNYTDSVKPMLTTGSVEADIILLPDQDTNQTYLKSGLFVALDEYFDEMPNYTKWLDENPVLKAQLTAQDGHIYYVPVIKVGKDYGPCLMYNQVWLDKAGMKAPETLDDFVTLLRYYRDNDMNGNGDASDEIPLSVTASYLPYMFGPAFGLNITDGFQADDQGKVSYAAADTENYKAYLEFLNSLYTEGLLEIEYNSLNRDQIIERCSNDLTGVCFDHSWAMSMMYSPVLPYYDGTAATAFVGAAPLSGTHEGVYIGGSDLGGMFGVTSASSDVALACRFLDYCLNDTNMDYYQWGIEGKSYVVDESGNKTFTEQGSDNDWLQQLGINPAFVFPIRYSVVATDVLVADWHAEINKWQHDEFVVEGWPFIYATDEESEVVNTYLTDIQTYVDENTTAFITGTKSLDEFDSYISGLEALHLADVVAVKQAQYDRYSSAFN